MSQELDRLRAELSRRLGLAARVCHEAVRVFNIREGYNALIPWDQATAPDQARSIRGVENVLRGLPSESGEGVNADKVTYFDDVGKAALRGLRCFDIADQITALENPDTPPAPVKKK